MNKTTRALIEALQISVLTCLLAITAIYVPILSFFMFFVTIPLIIIARRHGIKYAALSLAVSSSVIMIFFSPLTTLFLICLPGIPAITLGVYMNMGKPVSAVLTAGIVAAMLVSVTTLGISQQISGEPASESMRKSFETSVGISDSIYQSIPGVGEETIKNVNESMKSYIEFAILVVPAMLILWSCASTLINYWIASKILSRIKDPVEPLPPFREFRLPKNISIGIIIILILSMVASNLKIADPEMLSANMLMLAEVAFFMQGLAVVIYCMREYRVAVILKVIAILLLIFSRPGLIVMVLVGIFDNIFDFRKRVQNRLKD